MHRISFIGTTLKLVLLVVTTLLVGCNQQSDGYIAASSISNHGFARNGTAIHNLHGQDIKVWGFVDYSNLYGNEDVKKLLGERWSGEGSSSKVWRFNLKTAADTKPGESFPVYVPNDQGRDSLLRVFLANARAQQPTKVFLQGKILTFNAPTNMTSHTGLYMELPSSENILLELPKKS